MVLDIIGRIDWHELLQRKRGFDAYNLLLYFPCHTKLFYVKDNLIQFQFGARQGKSMGPTETRPCNVLAVLRFPISTQPLISSSYTWAQWRIIIIKSPLVWNQSLSQLICLQSASFWLQPVKLWEHKGSSEVMLVLSRLLLQGRRQPLLGCFLGRKSIPCICYNLLNFSRLNRTTFEDALFKSGKSSTHKTEEKTCSLAHSERNAEKINIWQSLNNFLSGIGNQALNALNLA